MIILFACKFSSCCCGCSSCSRLSGSDGYSFGRVGKYFRTKGTGFVAVSALLYEKIFLPTHFSHLKSTSSSIYILLSKVITAFHFGIFSLVERSK